MTSNRSKTISVAFTDPDTARLVRLLNLIESRPPRKGRQLAEVGSGLSGSALAPRPSFEEMMAIVNRKKGKGK